MDKPNTELMKFAEEANLTFLEEGLNNELFFGLGNSSLESSMKKLKEKGFTLISLFCEENFSKSNFFTLFYAFEKETHPKLVIALLHIDSKKAGSIGKIFPSAFWYEREIMDGFGIIFEGNDDKRRLMLHESYPEGFHPLLKSFKNRKITASQEAHDAYEFRKITGEGVYQIPVGPVHAGIIEPGHFRFSVIGETILNLEVRMFYKHRGIEKLAENKAPEDVVGVAESISGDESVANAVAFCTAVEIISGCIIPARALQLRAVMLELERIYSHLGDLAGMIIDVAYPIGASPFFIMREEIFRMNERLTGSRFMKGIISFGGLSKDIDNRFIKNLGSFLDKLESEFSNALEIVYGSPSAIDRLESTGVIKKNIIKPLNLSGPAARASGARKDTRIDHPYGFYNSLTIHIKTAEKGDVMSRFNVKAAEIKESAKIIKAIVKQLKDGKVNANAKLKEGYCHSLVESPRGQNFHWIHMKGGVVHRYKVRTASFCNWQSIEHAVLGNIVPDFPLINKSLNLSYAGTDM